MRTRQENAIAAQQGAVNPRPICAALQEAIGECYTEGIAPSEDAAVYMLLHQLVFILTGSEITDNGGVYHRHYMTLGMDQS